MTGERGKDKAMDQNEDSDLEHLETLFQMGFITEEQYRYPTAALQLLADCSSEIEN